MSGRNVRVRRVRVLSAFKFQFVSTLLIDCGPLEGSVCVSWLRCTAVMYAAMAELRSKTRHFLRSFRVRDLPSTGGTTGGF